MNRPRFPKQRLLEIVTRETRVRGIFSSVLVSLMRDEFRWETKCTLEMWWEVYLWNALEHEAASGHPASLCAPPVGVSVLVASIYTSPPPSSFLQALGLTEFQRLPSPDSGKVIHRISKAPLLLHLSRPFLRSSEHLVFLSRTAELMGGSCLPSLPASGSCLFCLTEKVVVSNHVTS